MLDSQGGEQALLGEKAQIYQREEPCLALLEVNSCSRATFNHHQDQDGHFHVCCLLTVVHGKCY